MTDEDRVSRIVPNSADDATPPNGVVSDDGEDAWMLLAQTLEEALELVASDTVEEDTTSAQRSWPPQWGPDAEEAAQQEQSTRSPLGPNAAPPPEAAAQPSRTAQLLRRIGWIALVVVLAVGANVATAAPLVQGTASGTAAAWYSLPLDDAWIHLDYVRGLATEGCFCYNNHIWEAGATSWGWVLLLAPFYRIGHMMLGYDPVLILKGVGIGLGVLITLLTGALLADVTRSRLVALVGAGLVTVEPTFAFQRVSGMEGPLIVATILGVSWAMKRRLALLTGLLLAMAFLARPDDALYVAAALLVEGVLWVHAYPEEVRTVGSTIVFYLIWDHSKDTNHQRLREGLTATRRLLRTTAITLVIIPPLVALVVWLLVNRQAILNNGLLTFSVQNFGNIFVGGVVPYQPWFAGLVGIPGAIAGVIGAIYIVRRGGLAYLPLAVFPILLIIGVSQRVQFTQVPVQFWYRRYVDPMVPIILIELGVAFWAIATQLRRSSIVNRLTQNQRAIILLPLYLALPVLIAFTVPKELTLWGQSIADYSWNSRNIWDEDAAAGLWIDQHTPPKASVLVADAGAIRYYGKRYTIDAAGLNDQRPIGQSAMNLIVTQRPNYLAIWDEPIFDQIPGARKLATFTTPRNTVLGGSTVAVYQLNWNNAQLKDPKVFSAVHPAGKVVDSFQIVDRTAANAHGYQISTADDAPWIMGTLNGVGLIDQGIRHHGAVTEKFTVAAIAGKPLTLVLRYGSSQAITAPVLVNGKTAGSWSLPGSAAQFQEATFAIPATLVTTNRVPVEIQWTAPTIEFRWWAVAP